MKKKNIFEKSFIELTGCVHNHSKYSFDSIVTISKIIKAAKINELDFITINDHNTLEAKTDPDYLNERELQIIIGMEINDPDNNNHYLVFNSDKILKGKTAEEYVEFYRKEGAFGFIAHPFETRANSVFRTHEWTNEENNNFDGIEIWNFLSEWVGKLNPRVNGLFFILFPSLFVIKPYRKVIKYWDQLNETGKRKAAIGSVDCHQEKLKKFGIKFKFLAHKSVFKTIRTNILIPVEDEINEQNILKTLKNGNSYIVNYKTGSPYNFYAGVSSGKKSAIFGEEIEFDNKLKYYFRIPKISKVKLFRNGEKIASKYSDKGYFKITEKGNYRLEITRFGRGWIYTNNIYVI